MAPLPPTPSGVVRSIIEYASADAFGRTRFDLAYTGGPPSTAGLNSIATAVYAAHVAHLQGLLAASGNLLSVTCIDLANPGTPEGADVTTTAGTRSGTAAPTQVMTLLNKVPARRYRGGKPKMFLPFGVEGDLTDPRTWGSSYISAVETDYTAFIAALSGTSVGGVTLGSEVCVSFFEGTEPNPNPKGRLQNVPVPRTTPLVKNITSTSCNPLVGTQRRRVRSG